VDVSRQEGRYIGLIHVHEQAERLICGYRMEWSKYQSYLGRQEAMGGWDGMCFLVYYARLFDGFPATLGIFTIPFRSRLDFTYWGRYLARFDMPGEVA
jgi:hypothetical protein